MNHPRNAGLLLLLFAVGGMAAEPKPVSGESMNTTETAEVAGCTITVVKTYAWRDWMKFVKDAGPDGGSPLYATVQFELSNAGGRAVHLSFQGEVITGNGNAIPISFEVAPNYRLIPEDVANRFRDLDERTKDAAMKQYNVLWDGGLKPGERRFVDLSASGGPYLPAKSMIRFRVVWKDEKGTSATLTTEGTFVNRTD